MCVIQLPRSCCLTIVWSRQDQSDHSRNVTPTHPSAMPTPVPDSASLWGQHFTALRFDGFAQGVCAGNSSAPLNLTAAPYTCFVVDRAEVARHPWRGGRTLQAADNGTSLGPWSLGVHGSSRTFVAGDGAPSPKPMFAGVDWHVSTVRASPSDSAGAGGTVRYWVDGLEQAMHAPGMASTTGGSQAPGVTATSTPGGRLSVGVCGDAGGAARGAPVLVAAVACYHRALPEDERGAVEGALAAAYGVALEACPGGCATTSVGDAACVVGRTSPYAEQSGVTGLQHDLRFDHRMPPEPHHTEPTIEPRGDLLAPLSSDPATWAGVEQFGNEHGLAMSGHLVALSRGWATRVAEATTRVAFVFERAGTEWVRTVLTDPEPADADSDLLYGAAIAVVESPVALVAVGKTGWAHNHTGDDHAGRVIVFCRGCGTHGDEPVPATGMSRATAARWRHAATIVEPAATASSENAFGTNIAFASDGSFMAVSAVGWDNDKGCVYLFLARDQGRTWVADDQLIPLSLNTAITQPHIFGYSVAIWGSADDAIVVVGAPGPDAASEEEANDTPGRAYIFEPSGGAFVDGVAEVRHESFVSSGPCEVDAVFVENACRHGYGVGVDVWAGRAVVAIGAPLYGNNQGYATVLACDRPGRQEVRGVARGGIAGRTTSDSVLCCCVTFGVVCVVCQSQPCVNWTQVHNASTGGDLDPTGWSAIVSANPSHPFIAWGSDKGYHIMTPTAPDLSEWSLEHVKHLTPIGSTADGFGRVVVGANIAASPDVVPFVSGAMLSNHGRFNGGGAVAMTQVPTGEVANHTAAYLRDFFKDNGGVGRRSVALPAAPSTANSSHASMSGGVLAVSNTGANDGKGEVYVVERRGVALGATDAEWQLTQRLTMGGDTNCGEFGHPASEYGWSVATTHWGTQTAAVDDMDAGQLIIVGAPGANKAFIYARVGGQLTRAGMTEGGGGFVCQAQLDAPAGGLFGASVDVDGCCTATVGARDAEQAYIYTRPDALSTTWSLTVTQGNLVPSGSSGITLPTKLGSAVALSNGGRLWVIGAPQQGVNDGGSFDQQLNGMCQVHVLTEERDASIGHNHLATTATTYDDRWCSTVQAVGSIFAGGQPR